MAGFPQQGMEYEDVNRRLKKYKSIKEKGNINLRDSLLRQAALHEGEGAVTELLKENYSGNSRSRYSGAGNKQCGFGLGYSARQDKSFRQVKPGKFIKVYK